MRRITVFNNISADGYFADEKGDMSWAHSNNPEWQTFIENNTKGNGELLFGRVTYDLMSGYWPTQEAQKSFPVVAEKMNNSRKIVFSNKMKSASWNNTRLIKGDVAAEMRKIKEESGPDIVILGSGSIVSKLSNEGLIDEYRIVITPVILGKGRTMFEGLKDKQLLRLAGTRIFGNGNIYLCYEPAKK